MTADTAETLAAAVDEVHYATRAPKYEVLAAIVRAGIADIEGLTAELRAAQAERG